MEMLVNDRAPPDGVGSIEPPTVSNRQVLGTITALCMGRALDLFDLLVLLFVAPVTGKLFFPSEHAMLSLATVYASFAVTLLMRSLESAIFGSYVDQRGREGAMMAAVAGVGMSTAAFGLLPTVGQVGLFALALFILLRLMQGIFVGGVVASTHTVGTESVPPSWRGVVSGLVGSGGAGIGALLVSITYMTVTMLFLGDAFEIWGWRRVFFAGIVSSVFGLVISSSLEESPLWKQLQVTKTHAKFEAHPIWALFSQEYRGIPPVNTLLTIDGGSAYYLTSGHLPASPKVVMKAPAGESTVSFMVGSLAVIVVSVAAGHFSSLIGHKRSFLLIGTTAPVLLPLFYQWLPVAPAMTTRFVYTASLNTPGCAGLAPILIFLNERSPASIRTSGIGLPWNIGFAIGGMISILASLTVRTPADLLYVLGVTVGAITLLYLAGVFIVPEATGRLGDSQQWSRPHSVCGMAVSGFFFASLAKWRSRYRVMPRPLSTKTFSVAFRPERSL